MLLAGSFLSASGLYSQRDSLRHFRNLIEIFNTRNNSLNGIYPNIQKEYGSHIFKNNIGVSYVRLLGRKGVGIELSYNEWNWGVRSRATAPSGTVFACLSDYFSARVHYPVLDKRSVSWYLSGGATLRTGSEGLVIVQPSIQQDGIGVWYPQRDLGLSVGSRLSWQPFWRIVLSSDLRYTRFVYRYTTSSEYLSTYQGTSKHLMSLQLKVGFAF
jgi:hypothetical protein